MDHFTSDKIFNFDFNIKEKNLPLDRILSNKFQHFFDLFKTIACNLDIVETQLNCENLIQFQKKRKYLSNFVYVIKELGLWPAMKLAELYITELSELIETDLQSNKLYIKFLDDFSELFNYLKREIFTFLKDYNNTDIYLEFISSKLSYLISFLNKNLNSSNNQRLINEKLSADRFSCVIFVKKEIVLVLSFYLQEVAKLKLANYKYLKADGICEKKVFKSFEGFKLITKEEILDKFKKHNCIIMKASTKIDLPEYKLAINFGLTSKKDFVISRERSKLSKCKFVLFVNENDQEWFGEDFARQENKLIKNSTNKRDELDYQPQLKKNLKDSDNLTNERPNYNKNKTSIYDKKVPSVLIGRPLSENKVYYCYVFTISLIKPLKSQNLRNSKTFDPANFDRNLGLITQNKIPKICSFTIYPSFGESIVDLKLTPNKLTLDNYKLRFIVKFNKFTFKEVLNLEKHPLEFNCNEINCPYLLVPIAYDVKQPDDKLNFARVDWNLIRSVDKYQRKLSKGDYLKPCDLATGNRPEFEFKSQLYEDAVIKTFYHRNGTNSHFYVSKVLENLNPLSCFPNYNHKNFVDYFKSRHNTIITNSHQPLLGCNEISIMADLLKPNYRSKNVFLSKPVKVEQVQILIPEICIVHPFKASFWKKALCLPSILYRLNSILLAEELRVQIASEIKVGKINLDPNESWPALDSDVNYRGHQLSFHSKPKVKNDSDWSSDDETIYETKRQPSSLNLKFDPLKNGPNCLGPDPSIILQALTLKNANDLINLERLEIVGDSFLKYAVTVYLYCVYDRSNVGQLSTLRSELVSNCNLSRLGKDKSLPEFMIASEYKSLENWLPPGVSVKQNKHDKTLDEKRNKIHNVNPFDAVHHTLHDPFTQQSISDKFIANSAEALIGSYLISSGTKAALLFMKWLGLKIMSNNIDELNEDSNNPKWHWLPEAKSPLLANKDNYPKLSKLNYFYKKSNLSRFEKEVLRYEFKDKSYLVQAFTHNSINDNTFGCYKRLEFLGDAVLGFLITKHLFEDPAKFSPGTLIRLRSVLVSNAMFATLAVKYGFHKYIRVSACSELNNDIREFAKRVEEDESLMKNGVYKQRYPKSLANVFESVAGALFMDSDCSLDVVWNAYYNMLNVDHFVRRLS